MTASDRTGTSAGTYGDSVAYAVPRDEPLSGAEVALPTPLEPSAAAQYRRIFQLQAAGHIAAADALIAHLDDPTLLGPVLAARYLGGRQRTSAAQLQDWLSRFGDQPDAPAIYALLLKRLPRGTPTPLAPAVSLLADPQGTELADTAASHGLENPLWRRNFASGLADWQSGDIARAATIFETAARSSRATADERAAGAFWAARAALRQQDPNAYLDWLHRAAAEPGTFYGILAERLLGLGIAGNATASAPLSGSLVGARGAGAALTEADVTAIDSLPNGHLAFALLQVGQTEAADRALRSLGAELAQNPGLARAALAVAVHAGLFDIAIALANGAAAPAANQFAGITLPLPALRPSKGFTVDPALVYALARTESGFDAHAVSPVGARGLMQLMPVTAAYMARRSGLPDNLADPANNLALGQSYLHYLGAQEGIDGNLLAVLASYNAGPNAASVWYNALKSDSDPLLFIETIPTDETRRFVRQVLADCWIYDSELGLRPKSLDEIAEGDFPSLRDYALASR